MKSGKSILAFVLIFVMMFSLSASAFADEAQYKGTKEFLKAVDGDESLTCSLIGIVENDQGQKFEEVSISYDGELSDYIIKMKAQFSEDGEWILLSVPELLKIDEGEQLSILALLNVLNAQSDFVKFYLESSNWAISSKLGVIVREGVVADIGMEAIACLVLQSDFAYQILEEYDT